MKRLLLFFGVVVAAVAFAKDPPVSYSGGDGSSFDHAIVIKAPNEQSGVPAEYAYIARHYPGYHRGSQALLGHGHRAFDVLEFTTKEGEKKDPIFRHYFIPWKTLTSNQSMK